jgi:hypothetical protein
VSSSSFTDAEAVPVSIATMLDRAFAHMELGCPMAFDEIARRLAGVTVRLAVDEETFDVRVADGAPRVGPPVGVAGVEVTTSRAAVRAVLSGETTLAEAVRADRVRATGRLVDLVALLDALDAFVHGAVRSEGIEQLYDDFQHEGVA